MSEQVKSQEEINDCRELIVLNWASKEDLRKKRGVIYRIFNKVNGKNYIGKSIVTFNQRYGRNGNWFKEKHNSHFDRAKRKYGKENFKIEILLENQSFEALDVWEKFFIAHYDSMNKNKGYNKTSGGNSPSRISDETKEKMRIRFTKTKKQFLEKAQKVHGNKYDYSLSEYINNETNLTIICKIHGEFAQTPTTHYRGGGCPKCNICWIQRGPKTQQEFIQELLNRFNDRFDYSETEYTGNNNKVSVRCIKHDHVFEMAAFNLLRHKFCCPKCKREAKMEAHLKKLPKIEKIDPQTGEVLHIYNHIYQAAEDIITDISKLKTAVESIYKVINKTKGYFTYKGYKWKIVE